MEVRPETGIISNRESFTVNVQKNAVQPQLPSQSMRLAFASDGTAIYKAMGPTSPPSPYQGGGGGGGGTEGAPDGGVTQPPPTHSLNMGMNVGDSIKKKRGRPRKYGQDGAISLALSPVPSASAPPASGGFASPAGMDNSATMTAVGTMKKARGRPPGSGKKQSLGSAGTGFVPHVITVKAGEDVSSTIMSFLQHGSHAVCILSANGAISNVTLRQAAISGGTVTYEGRFEILSLSGSFLLCESGGQRSRTGGLSVSLAGPDGRVLGGGVAGILTAASPVQVVVGSFTTDGWKNSPKPIPLEATSVGRTPPVGTTATGAPGSPASHGTLSESSGGPGSPPNQSAGGCSNGNQQGASNMPWK